MGYSQHGSREVKSPFSNFPRVQSREKQKKKGKKGKKSSRGFLSALFFSFSPSFFLLLLSLSLEDSLHLATTATRRPLSAVNPSSTFSEKFPIKKVAAQSVPIRLEA